MAKHVSPELILIRHGATDRPGHLCGRTDVELAEVPKLPAGSDLAAVPTIWVSPAKRARATAEGLWPETAVTEVWKLWEQDFGTWDGLPYAEVPDVGVLRGKALAELAGPGGESFSDVVARVEPSLHEAAAQARASGPVVVVAHAGVIRAALALAIGNIPAALAFEIDHLSVTRLRCLDAGTFSVISVNGALS